MKPDGAKPSKRPAKTRITSLVNLLRDTEKELQELSGGQLDAVVGQDGGAYLLREAQEKLQASEQALRRLAETQIAILNALPAHIALINPEGVVLTVNEAWRRYGSQAGSTDLDFGIGRNYLEICERAEGSCAEEARLVANGIRRVMRGALKNFVLEYPCHSDTDKQWYRVIVTPLDENHNLGAVIMHIDVTDRRVAEDMLRENVREQRQLAEKLEWETLRLLESQRVAHVGSWETDLQTYEILWTEETHRIFETDPVAFSPTFAGFLDFVHPEDRALLEDALRDSMSQDAPSCVEHRIQMPDGRIKYLEERWVVRRDAEGKPVKAIGTCQDITDRRLATERLRRSEELLQIAGRIARFGAWSVDLVEGRATWSDEVCAIHDLSPGWSPSLAEADQYVAPEWRERVDASFSASIREGSNFDMEFEIITALGRRRWVHSTGLVEKNALDVPIRMQGAFQDITQQKHAENEVRKAAKKLALIVQIQQEIANSNSPVEDLMTMVVQRAQEMTDASGAVMEILEGDCLVYQAVSGIVEAQRGFRLPRVGSLSGLAMEKGRVLGCDDVEKDPRVNLEACRRLGIRSMLVAPLRVGDRMMGVLKVLSDQVEAFSPREVNHMQILAETLGTVIERGQANERLRASEAQYRLLFQANPHPMWTYDVETLRFLAVNEAAVQHYGYSMEEFLQMTIRDLRSPEDYARMEAAVARLARKGRSFGLWQHYKKDGSIIDVEVSSEVIVFNGRPARLVLAHDVTDRLRNVMELQRSNRALQMLSGINEILIHATEENVLLQDVCRIAVESGGYRMAWVGYAQEDEAKTILPVASAGEGTDYLNEVKFSWSEEVTEGRGPAGTVIRSGQAIICDDVEQTAIFEPWREKARERGFRGVASLPLNDGKRIFGVLILYADSLIQANEAEIKLLQEMADDLAFGIGNLRSRGERKRLQDAVVKVASSVSISSGVEFFHDLLNHMVGALGAGGGFISELIPGEPSRARMITSVNGGGRETDFVYTVGQSPCADLEGQVETVATACQDSDFQDLAPWLGGAAKSYVARRLMDSTGEVVGHLFVYFGRRIKEVDFILSHVRIFATRTGAELERRKSEEKLREQADLLDAASDAIILKDLDDRIIYWNRGAERIYGWQASEVMGMTTRELLYQDLQLYAEAYNTLMEEGQYRGEMGKRTKEGRVINVDVSWTLVRDKEGKPRSVLAINTDITERKKLEAQFLRAQRMESIGTLAGGIAHDLNNILAPILLGVDILKTKVNDEPSREMLNTLATSAKRGADLVRQVLSFARGVEGKRIALNELHILREIQKIVADTFPKNITFQLVPKGNLWSVLGDPTQIHQVFMNLCVNARDAMPHGGTLKIIVENIVLDEVYAGMNPESRAGSYVVAAVSDSGIGISREMQEKIFDPFFTTKEVGKGTGLGLSTTLAIVKSHGGFINLYSELGKGTTFKVYFPATATAEVMEKVALEQTEFPRGNGELVLVVDDEKPIRVVAQKTLERYGYHVLLASNGAEAVALYAKHSEHVALVLTDMAMPVMDGPSTILALKSINPAVKIIGSSGMASNGGVSKALGAGVKHFIPKPYTAEAMLQVFHQALQEMD